MKHGLIAVLITASLVLAPEAFARAGKGGSMGSRGDRTYDRPIERSVTPPPSPGATQPGMAPAPGATQPGLTGQQPMYNPGTAGANRMQPGMAGAAPMAQPGFFQRNPFLGGVLGGMVGMGIGSLLFGNSAAAAAADAAPMASMLGLLMQVALIGGLVWLAFRLFRRRSPVPAGGAYERSAQGPMGGYAAAPASAPRVEQEFGLTPADQQAFTEILVGVQRGWSEGDIGQLRRLCTPEIVSWLLEDQSANASRGVRNVVEDVTLLKGDLAESWSEGVRDYVTVVLSFSCRDYDVRLDNGQVVEGSAKEPVEVTERWTFTRSQGGNWLLSAIEQA